MYNSMYYNGFNPYITGSRTLGRGLLGSIGKINWSNFLTNTQKTLNVINQAIPVYYQVKPIYNNAKTMFRLIGSMNSKEDTKTTTNTQTLKTNEKNINNQPIFFT